MKAVALADIELCLSEGISQSVSQSVENLENSAKFRSNFLKAFQVTMHTSWTYLCSPYGHSVIDS